MKNRVAKLLTAVVALGAVVGLGTVSTGTASAVQQHVVQHPLDTGWGN